MPPPELPPVVPPLEPELGVEDVDTTVPVSVLLLEVETVPVSEFPLEVATVPESELPLDEEVAVVVDEPEPDVSVPVTVDWAYANVVIATNATNVISILFIR